MTREMVLMLALVACGDVCAEAFRDLYEIEPGKAPSADEGFHTPPDWSRAPGGEMGNAVRRGFSLFMDTQQLKPSGVVNNGLQCSNCHLGSGRVAGAAPMWAAYVSYPAYRSKNNAVNTFADRLQGCFVYSMNARGALPPSVNSQEILDLTAYSYWLATDARVNSAIPGRGFANIAAPQEAPDYQRGEQVYRRKCSTCHAENGAGRKVANRYVFPPLWGKDSYNWGAGMHRVNTAAAFIKANMPLGQGYSLTDQQAWDVALYIDSHERPQDPRFNGNLGQTKETYHNHQGQFGEPSPGSRRRLGSAAD